MARRAAGEPLQYVLGRWAFRTLDLMVDRRVLIPRPRPSRWWRWPWPNSIGWRAAVCPPDGLVAVDLGTGSGAIALSLAAERPRLDVWATDVSPGALAVAGANLAGLGGGPRPGSGWPGAWWAAVPEQLRGRVDLVVSNPPYISSGEMTGLDAGVVDWEPDSHWRPAPPGSRRCGRSSPAPAWLRPGGRRRGDRPPSTGPGRRLAERRPSRVEVRRIWPVATGRSSPGGP